MSPITFRIMSKHMQVIQMLRVQMLQLNDPACHKTQHSQIHTYFLKKGYLLSTRDVSLLAQRVKNRLQCGRPGFNPWVGKIPWRRAWQPTPVFLPGESPRTEEPGGLQSMGSQRVGHDWVTKHSTEKSNVLLFQYNMLFSSTQQSNANMTEPVTAWFQSRFSATGSLQLWPKQAHFDSCSSLWLYSLSYPFLSAKIYLSSMALVKYHLLRVLANVPSGTWSLASFSTVALSCAQWFWHLHVHQTPSEGSRNNLYLCWTPICSTLIQEVYDGVKMCMSKKPPPHSMQMLLGQRPHFGNNNEYLTFPQKAPGEQKINLLFLPLFIPGLHSVSTQQIFVKLNVHVHVASYMFVYIHSYSFNKYLLQTYTFEICIYMVRIFKVQAGFLIISHLAN